MPQGSSVGPSTPQGSSVGLSTNPSSYHELSTHPKSSSGSSGSGPTECSNCKVKDLRIKMLEARLKMVETRLEMERHPEDHAERVRLLVSSTRASKTTSYSPRPSTPPSYSPEPSTSQSYSPGPSRNAECLNCKLLLGKIKVLEATVEMYTHLEQHTLNSTALLHEVYNDMGKLSLE
ncbi:hypothetical protein Tco_0211481 [Tanacetum coccineum]